MSYLTFVAWRRQAAALLLALLLLVSAGRPAAAADPPAEWALEAVEAEAARVRGAAVLRGAEPAPVTVAVLDSGADERHPALAGRLWPGLNAVGGDPAGVADVAADAHGTHVASIIAAATAGYPVKILPVRVLAADSTGSVSDLAAAVRAALSWRGPAGERVRIINLSLGERLSAAPQELAEAVRQAVRQGVLLVAAAGNEGRTVSGYYPAALPGVLSVAATRPDHTRAARSNEGALLLAPGADVYARGSGSSYAAPFVSAGAAVLWSVHPERSRGAVLEALLGAHVTRTCPEARGCPVFSIDRALAALGPLRAPVLDPLLTPANRTAIIVSGSSTPGAAVTIRYATGGGKPVEAATVLAGPDGRFRAPVSLPGEGAYAITAVAGLGEEESQPSATAKLTVDLRAPGRLPLFRFGGVMVELVWRTAGAPSLNLAFPGSERP